MSDYAPTNQQKTRNLRMDDTRWKYFREKLGTDWLRMKIDEAIENKTNAKHSDQ